MSAGNISPQAVGYALTPGVWLRAFASARRWPKPKPVLVRRRVNRLFRLADRAAAGVLGVQHRLAEAQIRIPVSVTTRTGVAVVVALLRQDAVE